MIQNLRHIQAFLAVHKAANFTRAAAELRISQSALTVQIKQLESSLGITLFDRGKRNVTLTQAGQDLRAPLERLLIDAEELVSRTREIAGLRRGIVSMAVLPSIANTLVPLAVKRFTRLYPGVVVQIHDIVADKIIDAVRNDDVDFGIGGRSRPSRELRSFPLLVDQLAAFLSSKHELAAQRSLTLKQIIKYPLILTSKNSSVRTIVERAMKQQRLVYDLAYETNYMSTALGLAEAGLGIAILPESAAGSTVSPTLKRIAIQGPALSRKIDLIQTKQRALSPAATRMIGIIREQCTTQLAK